MSRQTASKWLARARRGEPISDRLFDGYAKDIRNVLFTGIREGVFGSAKFDSVPELYLAQVLETDDDVVNWLRPAPEEFNITYNRGRSYEPDFVVETGDVIYLVEVKGENMLEHPDVIVKTCNTAKLRAAGARLTGIRSGGICSYRPSRYSRLQVS